jgi:hypothetical protein
MQESFRKFDAGPDPFGRRWNVKFGWLQTAISIRHADAIDIKFFLSCEGSPPQEKVISLPHLPLLHLARHLGREVTDSWCSRLAARHMARLIETFEDMDKTLVTVSPADLQIAAAASTASAQHVLSR